jgi:hypothetical protein
MPASSEAMLLVDFQESIIIFASLLLVMIALIFIYWRFLRYRKAARERFLKEQKRAREEGLEVPPDIAKELDEIKE